LQVAQAPFGDAESMGKSQIRHRGFRR